MKMKSVIWLRNISTKLLPGLIYIYIYIFICVTYLYITIFEQYNNSNNLVKITVNIGRFTEEYQMILLYLVLYNKEVYSFRCEKYIKLVKILSLIS